MDTLLGQFAHSLNRALEFVVDRLWIDVIALAIVVFLPTRNRQSFPDELAYAILATFVLFVVRENVLRPQYDQDAQIKRLMTQMALAENKKTSF